MRLVVPCLTSTVAPDFGSPMSLFTVTITDSPAHSPVVIIASEGTCVDELGAEAGEMHEQFGHAI